LERDKIVKASFFAKNKEQLEFLIKALAKIVGKDNVNYLVPIFQHKSQTYILNMDIRIPEPLVRYQNIRSNDKYEEGR